MGLAKLAGTSPFANFRKKAAIVKAEDEKDEDNKEKKSKAEDEKDEDDKEKKSKAEDEKDEDDKEKKSKAEEEDDEGDEDEKKKSKKSKKAEGDDEEDDDEPEAHVRKNERARIRAIIESDAGQANVEAAYELAVNSNMSTATAIAVLKSVGPKSSEGTRDTLRDRMSSTRQPDIGAGDEGGQNADETSVTANRILAAGKKARGEAA